MTKRKLAAALILLSLLLPSCTMGEASTKDEADEPSYTYVPERFTAEEEAKWTVFPVKVEDLALDGLVMEIEVTADAVHHTVRNGSSIDLFTMEYVWLDKDCGGKWRTLPMNPGTIRGWSTDGSSSAPTAFEGVLRPGEEYSGSFVYGYRLDKYPAPGNYRIRQMLCSNDDEKTAYIACAYFTVE